MAGVAAFFSEDKSMSGFSNGSENCWDGRDWIATLVAFCTACVLIFSNLGDRHLWQDEAETALIAHNVLQTGLPMAWDGKRLVTQNEGKEMTDSFLWAWTPWMMHYVAAAGMAVAGETSFGARWLFGLIGTLAFPVFYWLVRRKSNNRFLAVTAVALLLSSVQYLLLMRQCRYYALLPLAFFVAVAAYLSLPSKRCMVILIAAGIFLFHSNYVSSVIALAGLLLHAAIFRRREAIWGQLALSGLAIGATTVPWIMLTGVFNRVSPSLSFAQGAVCTLIMANRYVCPWLLIIGVVVGHSLKRAQVDQTLALSFSLLVPMFFFLPALLWPNPRYVSFLLPIGMLVEAHAIESVYRWKSWLGIALAIVLVASNVLIIPLPALIPTRIGREWSGGAVETGKDALALGLFKSEIAGYVFEITHKCHGPDEELASFVQQNTASEDVIGITHDGLSTMFHTGRALAGLLDIQAQERPGWNKLPRYLSDITQARWIIIRPERLGSEGMSAAELLDALQQNNIRIEKSFHLNISDVRWINNPLIAQHVFNPSKVPGEPVDVLLLTHSIE